VGFSESLLLDPEIQDGLKIVKSPYFNEKSCDFDEIWYTAAHYFRTWQK